MGHSMHSDRLTDEEARLAALRRYDILESGDEAAFRRVVDLASLALDAPVAAMTLIDDATLVVKAAVGASLLAAPRADTICTHTIRQAEPLIVPDTTLDPRFAKSPLVAGAPHLRAYLGVPLATPDGYNVGTLWVGDSAPRQFAPPAAAILEKLAAIAVEQMEMRQIAKQDAMTGALTRRGFFAEVEKEYARASRYDRPSSLVLIDVDRFRAINDRYGHLAGDAVLVAIANASMASMRRSDVFGRTGGEEFGLLLPETDLAEATQAAERIRRMVEDTIIEVPGASVRATVSLGVAAMPGPGEGASAWLADADVALYEAKQFGRNRVTAGRQRQHAGAAPPLEQQARRPH